MKQYEALAQQDGNNIKSFESLLAQAGRNAGQGELGRALGVSKVSEIKDRVNALKQNFIAESGFLQDAGKSMAKMHEPKILDFNNLSQIEKKSAEVFE